MHATRDTIQHFFRFIIVGLLSTIVNYIFFLLFLKEVGLQYQISSICGFLIGVTVGFPLNKIWTYQCDHAKKNKSSLYKYGCVYLFSLVVNFYVLGFLVKHFGFDPRAANGVAIIVTTLINFIGTKFWAFRPSPEKGLKVENSLY